MKVYVLNEGVDYEGEYTLGVYSTRDLASAAAADHIDRIKPDSLHIHEITIDETPGHDWDTDNTIYVRPRGRR